MGRHSAPGSVLNAPVVSARVDDSPTERIAVVPAAPSQPRRDLRLAKKTAQRRYRKRASMVAVTSIMAGFGASTVLAGTGQPAAAVAPTLPVTSSLEAKPDMDATVPAGFADNAEAADIARIRAARLADEQLNSGPAVCGTESANGLRSAVVDGSEQAVILPVSEGTYRLSSPYGVRQSPFGDGYNNHAGTDFAAELGTPIYAVADGTVEYVGVGKDGRSSNLIIIRHEVGDTVFWTWYVHMYDDGLHVAEGESVSVGQHIADIGNNGNSTGPHLHFEVHTDDGGTTVEPLGFLEKLGAGDIAGLCS